MTSPVFVFVIMFLYLQKELLDCDAGTALLINLLVLSILIVCDMQLLFLIRGVAARFEEQIPEWLHLRFCLPLSSGGCKVVECL